MGYWISYLGVGYGGERVPYFGNGDVLLFSAPVVIAGLLVPALALAGFALAHRWRYGAVLPAARAGRPGGDGRRLPGGDAAAARDELHLQPPLAGPVPAHDLQGGPAAGARPRRAWPAARRRGCPAAGRPAAAAAPGGAGGRRGLAAGQRPRDRPAADLRRVPAPWRRPPRHVDATVGEDGRAVVLPGQLYGYYRWGGTIDAILPALAERPVAVRYAVPYADLRAVDLLWTTDALVQQRRALPGQLDPLLDLLSARTVVAAADDDRACSGAVPPGDAADVLAQLGPPDERWGAVRPERRAAGTLGGPRAAAAGARLGPRRARRRLVRLEPDAGATVRRRQRRRRSPGWRRSGRCRATGGSPTPATCRDAELRRAAGGGEVVISDSNRRRVLAAARMAQNHGATLAADDPFSPDAAVLDLFPPRGSDGADRRGLRRRPLAARCRSRPPTRSSPSGARSRPSTATPRTHWQADRALEPARHWLEIGFDAPRDVDSIELLPYSDRRGGGEGGRGRRAHLRRAAGLEPAPARAARRALAARADRARARARRRARTAPAGSASCASPACRCARRCARRCSPSARCRPRPLAHRPDLPVRAHDRRRPVPARPAARHRRRGARARPPGRRARARARDRAARRARVAGGRLGDRRPAARRTPRSTRWSAARGGAVRLLGPLRGPAGVPGLERVRRHAAAVDRLLARRAHGLAGVDGAARRRPLRELRLEPAARARAPPDARAAARRTARRRAPLPVGATGAWRCREPLRGRTFRLEILRAAFPDGRAGRASASAARSASRELTRRRRAAREVPRDGARARAAAATSTARSASAPLRMRADASVADLDAGRPLRFRAVRAPVDAPGAAPRASRCPPARSRPYLRAAALAGARSRPAPAAPGRVLDPGTPGATPAPA